MLTAKIYNLNKTGQGYTIKINLKSNWFNNYYADSKNL